MIVKCATIFIHEEYIEAFKAASLENQQHSVKEEGIINFNILQSSDDPCCFLFYETYKDQEAVESHTKTPHFNKWNDIVMPMFSKPRERALYTVVTP